MVSVKYDALTEPDSIRILLLEPSPETSSQIRCSLVHTTLAICKDNITDEYTALSYVWGNPSTSRSILVNGKAFNVTTNLFHALRDLRDDHEVRRLWIDAICIDQSNVNERNRQVSIMGFIYTLAQHTVIHLGDYNFDVYLAFRELTGRPLKSWNGLEDPLQHRVTLRHAARDIISQPWFTRVWIFQELVMSRDPWIQYGEFRMKWDEFCEAIEFLKDRVNGTDGNHIETELHKNLRVLEDMQDIRQKFQAAKSASLISPCALIDILQARRGFGASDPRDRIFAHLGIAAPLHKKITEYNIQVDYNKRVSEIYTGLAMNAIRSAQNVEILRFVERVSPANRSLNIPRKISKFLAERLSPAERSLELPSWVPDWSLPISHNPRLLSHSSSSVSQDSPELLQPGPLSKRGPEDRSMTSCAHISMFLLDPARSPTYKIWLQDPTMLAIDGFQIDVVESVSPAVLEWDPHLKGLMVVSVGIGRNMVTDPWKTYCKFYDAWRNREGFEFLRPLLADKPSTLEVSYSHGDWSTSEDEPSIASQLFLHRIKRHKSPTSNLTGRSIASFQTPSSKMGLVPAETKPGDLLC
ncbi:HET-domain-containing protein [Hyaloscypha hepaticicola]|uniref:HET-domain-containing protein n=1 Tax=Hyaloscypha hepaticicola TaxID=2082293 RepID=A0A2J6PMR4_9HELO|nr:HET-domain-containing protein [Hyaloscypha hepaticicola]